MSTVYDINAAISTFKTVARQLESAKLLIYNQHIYFQQAVELASTQEEKLVLIGAYLATKNLMQDTEQQSAVEYLKFPINPELSAKADLEFHFSQ